MKICIPVENKNGLDSVIFGHFGSAPSFIIFDFESNNYEEIDNSNNEHAHGQCNPLQSFVNHKFEIMVTGGIGARALMKLNSAGVKVYQTTVETRVSDVIDSFNAGTLIELTPEHSCQHHNCH